MQLTRRGRIGQALAVATYSLLAGPVAGAAQTDQVDLSDLHYAEVDRVKVDEQVFSLQHDRKNNKTFSLKLFHDAITGATPNGAADPATLTSPSGTTYTSTLAPIVDERYAVNASWQSELSRLTKRGYGFTYSTELDYNSLGMNWQHQRDTRDRMRTYSYGFSLDYDTVHAQGGIPTPLAPVTNTTRTSSANKEVGNFIAGMTQIINRSSLWQLSYTLGYSNGYLTDPYKVFTVSGDTTSLQFEKRPDTRLGNSVYLRYIRRNNSRNVLRFSYRYYMDDWGIISHTLDLKYHYPMRKHWYLQPHLRVYSQSAAYFYGYKFYSTTPVTGNASGDYRLGNLASVTVGLQLGREFSKRLQADFRMEYLQQQDRLNQFPTLKATIAQINFRYLF